MFQILCDTWWFQKHWGATKAYARQLALKRKEYLRVQKERKRMETEKFGVFYL